MEAENAFEAGTSASSIVRSPTWAPPRSPIAVWPASNARAHALPSRFVAPRKLCAALSRNTA